jgi:hypothetical protein
VAGGRERLFQPRWAAAPHRTYLVRVFVALDRDPPEAVTVCRTSRIAIGASKRVADAQEEQFETKA